MTRIIKRLENHVVAGLRLPIEVTRLNRREREIATVVYALHAGTAEDVCFNLSDELNNASVRSMLNRLVEKGILRRTRSGRAFVYLRKGDAIHANADAAAARKISARIDDIFAEYGLKFDHPLAAAATAH